MVKLNQRPYMCMIYNNKLIGRKIFQESSEKTQSLSCALCHICSVIGLQQFVGNICANSTFKIEFIENHILRRTNKSYMRPLMGESIPLSFAQYIILNSVMTTPFHQKCDIRESTISLRDSSIPFSQYLVACNPIFQKQFYPSPLGSVLSIQWHVVEPAPKAD